MPAVVNVSATVTSPIWPLAATAVVAPVTSVKENALPVDASVWDDEFAVVVVITLAADVRSDLA